MPKLPDVRSDDEDRQLLELPPQRRAAAAEWAGVQEHPFLRIDAFGIGGNRPGNQPRSFADGVLQRQPRDPDNPAGSIQSVSRQRVTAKGSGELSGFAECPFRSPGRGKRPH
jgi:hypothetical protein